MAAPSPVRLATPAGGPPPIPPQDIYRIAVDEYRFQAQFNWTRTQYLLGLNALILVAGTTLSRPAGTVAMLVFSFGAIAAVLSALVIRTQHGYYRSARSHMVRIEIDLGIPVDQRLDTTTTLGDRPRFLSVNQVIYLLLGAIAVADASGAIIVISS
jgi:hypothetical protein